MFDTLLPLVRVVVAATVIGGGGAVASVLTPEAVDEIVDDVRAHTGLRSGLGFLLASGVAVVLSLFVTFVLPLFLLAGVVLVPAGVAAVVVGARIAAEAIVERADLGGGAVAVGAAIAALPWVAPVAGQLVWAVLLSAGVGGIVEYRHEREPTETQHPAL